MQTTGKATISVKNNPGFLLDSTRFDMPHDTRAMSMPLAIQLLKIREAIASDIVGDKEAKLEDLVAFFEKNNIVEGPASANEMARKDANALLKKYQELSGPSI